MIICNNENERLVLECVLNYVFETHTNYWSSDADIDYDKKEYHALFELQKHIQNNLGSKFLENNNFDLWKFLYQLNGDN